jgi:S-adenosylmethionine decarboxylase
MVEDLQKRPKLYIIEIAMKYQKGLHIICDIEQASFTALSDVNSFKLFIEQLVQTNSLTATGAVYHSFENGGFTAIVGLTESHLSVHTWPEFKRVTFDIFLSNYLKVNDGTCLNMSKDIQKYFDGLVEQEHQIQR